MKFFTCTDHAGHWPVGVASIVLAEDEEEAWKQLSFALALKGLSGDKPFTLVEVPLTTKTAIVLNDGDY